MTIKLLLMAAMYSVIVLGPVLARRKAGKNA
jgi:hypothetical protein